MVLKINDRIRNRKLEFFDKFNLSLRYDSIASSFSFSGYFNPDNIEHKEMYCVGHYHLATLEHNNELLLTGYILDQGFSRSQVRQLVTFNGYSLPGVLEDCNIPPSEYPLQYDNLSLRDISAKLIRPFGLKQVIDSSVSALMDKVFDTTKAEPSETVKDYLTKLAAQRNIVISHDPQGRVVYTVAKTKNPPLFDLNILKGNAIPGTTISLSFAGQSMHSHIHVLKQADEDGGNAGESEIRNPFVPFVYRPKVIIQSSGDDNDTNEAAKRALAAELKGIKVIVTTDRWEVNQKIIKPNNTITVTCPDVYLYNKTTLFIEQIDFEGDVEKTVARLTCSLPEVYNNETPKYLWAGINLH